MVLDATLLNTQPYKVRVKWSNLEKRERSPGVVASENGAFGLPSTMVANFTYF